MPLWGYSGTGGRRGVGIWGWCLAGVGGGGQPDTQVILEVSAGKPRPIHKYSKYSSRQASSVDGGRSGTPAAAPAQVSIRTHSSSLLNCARRPLHFKICHGRPRPCPRFQFQQFQPAAWAPLAVAIVILLVSLVPSHRHALPSVHVRADPPPASIHTLRATPPCLGMHECGRSTPIKRNNSTPGTGSSTSH